MWRCVVQTWDSGLAQLWALGWGPPDRRPVVPPDAVAGVLLVIWALSVLVYLRCLKWDVRTRDADATQAHILPMYALLIYRCG